jgi:hypothetical protein
LIYNAQVYEYLCADVGLIGDSHCLSQSERMQLVRIITGAIPGNRDRPLFLLAVKLCQSETIDIFDLILPGQTTLVRLDAALLDFIFTVATVDSDAFHTLLKELDASRRTEKSISAAASALSRVLHGYRARVLPETRHHNVFTAIRRFFAHHRPQDPTPRDGDALMFWEAEGTCTFLTRFVTALNALSDFADAIRLSETWRFGVALDDRDALALPDDVGKEHKANDPLAPDLLEASITALAETPLKIVMVKEIDTLRVLISISGATRRWPCDSMAAIGFGPIQSMITEAMRRKPNALDVSAYLGGTESYTDIPIRYALLNEKLLDALHLAHLYSLPASETGSARSNMNTERKKRIAAMERRKSFSEMDAAVRRATLAELIEPLVTLRTLLEAVCASWDKFSTTRWDSVQQDHQLRFHAKFDLLYRPQKGVDVE